MSVRNGEEVFGPVSVLHFKYPTSQKNQNQLTTEQRVSAL